MKVIDCRQSCKIIKSGKKIAEHSSVTAGGGGGRVPDISHREIFVDLPGRERQRKKKKENGEEKKENRKREGGKWKKGKLQNEERTFFPHFTFQNC